MILYHHKRRRIKFSNTFSVGELGPSDQKIWLKKEENCTVLQLFLAARGVFVGVDA